LSFFRWEKRDIGHELMDECDPSDAHPTLRDLVRINRYFGGHRAIRSLLKNVAQRNDRFSLLDVGAASGDSSRAIKRAYPFAKVLSVDRNQTNLIQAPDPKLIADAFALPFKDGSFDYVFCSSFLHHFSDEQIVELFGGFRRIAKRAVLIVDIERHYVPYWFMRLSKRFLGWHWLTVYDGLLSVRAGLTSSEITILARRAGLTDLIVANHRPAFRISLMGKA